jgi:hypothetical protein
MSKPVLAINFRYRTCIISRNEQNRANTLQERCVRKSCPILLRLRVHEFAWHFSQNSTLLPAPLHDSRNVIRRSILEVTPYWLPIAKCQRQTEWVSDWSKSSTSQALQIWENIGIKDLPFWSQNLAKFQSALSSRLFGLGIFPDRQNDGENFLLKMVLFSGITLLRLVPCVSD